MSSATGKKHGIELDSLCCEYAESTRGFSLWIETLIFCAGRTPSLITDKVGMVEPLVYLQSKKIILMRQIPPKPLAWTAGTENNSHFKSLFQP